MSKAKTDARAFTALAKARWQKIWSKERSTGSTRRSSARLDVVWIVPNLAVPRLATAAVIEAHDEWQVTGRYLSDVSMEELRAVIAKNHAAAALAWKHQITKLST